MKEDNVDFIARHYEEGRFSEKEGWKRLGIVSPIRRIFVRVAASVAGVAVLSATAAIVWRNYAAEAPQSETVPADTVQQTVVAPECQVRVIDFENAPLPEVVEKISEVYGVSISEVPADARDYHLSLHYEGNARDLVETINELLAIELKILE